MRVLKVEPHDKLEELVKRMKQESHPKVKEGLRVVIRVKQGYTAKQTAAMLHMHPETARKKIPQYNAHGIPGLSPNYQGRTSALTPKDRLELRKAIAEWEAPEQGAAVLQGRDIQKWIQQNYGVKYHLHSIYRLLKEMGISWLCPRPRHPKGDPEKQAAFREPVPKERVALQKEHPHKKKSRSGFLTNPVLVYKVCCDGVGVRKEHEQRS